MSDNYIDHTNTNTRITLRDNC